MSGPVYNNPLVLCDAATVKPDDLVSVERRAENRIGELQVALHSSEHRWYYFPEMQMDEALLFKTFDSETDGRARFTIHTSFENPHAPADARHNEIGTHSFVDGTTVVRGRGTSGRVKVRVVRRRHAV